MKISQFHSFAVGCAWLIAMALGVGCGGNDSTTTSGAGGAPGGGAVGPGGAGGQGGSDCSEEVCDGIDNDCDQQVDEDCACIDGDTQDCYSGPPDTEDVGACTSGIQTCDTSGTWGSCDGEVVPSAEMCNGVDDDCNDAVDEGFGSVTCGLGACQVTVDECIDGNPNPCIPGTPNAQETCDGSDDDCDGQVDEGCNCTNGQTQPCYTGSPSTQNVGECHDGMQTCSSGQWGVCVGDQTPSNELCDGLDNDCDGNPDDGNPEGGGSCSTGLPGVCAPGHLQCLSAQLSCVQDVQPSADVCNNLDDDCDPSTPDGSDDGAVGVPCDGPDGDLCAEGLSVCNAGVIGCNDSTGNTLDVCNNADDDCDPSSPDGSEDPQNGMACDGPDSDLCQEGTMSCVSGTLVCSDNTGSTLDVCDGIDNDCDPASADGSEDPQNGAACDGPDSDLCLEGTQSCVNGSLACSDTTGSTLDVCDGIDNDCDSASADGSEDPQNGAGCDGPDTDLCDEGTQSCVSGSFVCSDNTGNNVELCNGIDDDCNSATADGSGDPQVGTACDGNDTDLCAEGTRFCSNGMLACNDNTGNNLDVCNGGDDDCNPATADGSAESWYGAACDGNDVDVCAEGTFGCVSGSQVCSDNTGDSNIILDTSFEAGFMGGVWTESSSNFGSPICDTASCPLGGGTGPRTGSNWAWFGGIDANETGIVSQVRVIPTGTATLTFWLEIPVCDGTGGTDTFTVRMDGNIVFTRTNTHSSCNLLGYSKQTVSVSAYADGGSHTIEFRGVFSASGTGVTNFFVDDVRLEPCP